MTSTLIITGRDRQYLLMDLWDIPGLGEHIEYIRVQRPDNLFTCHVLVDWECAVDALLVALDAVDYGRLSLSQDCVVVRGEYRGVPVAIRADFPSCAAAADAYGLLTVAGGR